MKERILKLFEHKRHTCPNCKKCNYPVWYTLLILLMFVSCNTYNIYLIDSKENNPSIKIAPGRVTNRFEKSFNQADSIFMAKIRKASKQAVNEANGQEINN